MIPNITQREGAKKSSYSGDIVSSSGDTLQQFPQQNIILVGKFGWKRKIPPIYEYIIAQYINVNEGSIDAMKKSEDLNNF